MSDVPAKNFGPSILRVSELSAETKPGTASSHRPQNASARRDSEYGIRPSLVVNGSPTVTVGRIVGFLILLAGVILATIPIDAWARLVGWAWPAGITENHRWITVGAIAFLGLLFLPTRAIGVVINSVLFAVTIGAADRLLNDRASAWINAYLGVGATRYVMAVGSLFFGYWTQAGSSGAPNVRGILGLGLTLLAAFGTIRGWYDWSPIAERLGPGVIKILKDWGKECTWATVLVITALGVSSSRTRPIHFLIAILLGALAYQCVREGYYQLHTFPDLSKGGNLISCESMSYANVERWRWIAAAELTVLAAILLHLAAGIGGLSIAAALGWMLSALAIYHSVGSISLLQSYKDVAHATNSAPVDPLANMGIPAAQGRGQLPRILPARNNSSSPGLPEYQLDPTTARLVVIREAAPMAWMFFTALLAGLIAVSGFNMLSDHEAARSVLNSLLWFAFGIALTTLLWVWPRDPNQSWEAWIASWRISRYHTQTIWLMFLATMAVASTISMSRQKRASTWVQIGAAAAFLGTFATLTAIAILTKFGGFPPLPPWVYIVVVVIQSSLGWILVSSLSFIRSSSPRRFTA